jgi:hypothetical protein
VIASAIDAGIEAAAEIDGADKVEAREKEKTR